MINLIDTATGILGWGHSHGLPKDWILDSRELEKYENWLFSFPVKGQSIIDKPTGEPTGEKRWELHCELLQNADTRKVNHKQRGSLTSGTHETHVDPSIKFEGLIEKLLEELRKLDVVALSEVSWDVKFREREGFKMNGVEFRVSLKTWGV